MQKCQQYYLGSLSVFLLSYQTKPVLVKASSLTEKKTLAKPLTFIVPEYLGSSIYCSHCYPRPFRVYTKHLCCLAILLKILNNAWVFVYNLQAQ